MNIDRAVADKVTYEVWLKDPETGHGEIIASTDNAGTARFYFERQAAEIDRQGSAIVAILVEAATIRTYELVHTARKPEGSPA